VVLWSRSNAVHASNQLHEQPATLQQQFYGKYINRSTIIIAIAVKYRHTFFITTLVLVPAVRETRRRKKKGPSEEEKFQDVLLLFFVILRDDDITPTHKRQ
jgi:hypothetical protein